MSRLNSCELLIVGQLISASIGVDISDLKFISWANDDIEDFANNI